MNWQNNFLTFFKQHDVLIVFGNIYDEFPVDPADMSTVHFCSIETVIEHKLNGGDTAPHNATFKIEIVDLVKPKGNPFEPLKRGNETGGKTGERRQRNCYLYKNAQAIFGNSQHWDTKEWEHHEALIALIEGTRGKDKVILMFPDENCVPSSFLQNVPNVRRFFIPKPTSDEIKRYFRSRADDVNLIKNTTFKKFFADCVGLRWIDIRALGNKCADGQGNINSETPVLEKLSEFKFGQAIDYWGALRKKLASAETDFTSGTNKDTEAIHDQDRAVRHSLNIIKKACLNLGTIISPGYQRPRGIMFFVGPTGVGKTMLAKKLANLIFESEDKLLTFDMSEYSQPQSEARLIGAPPGYVGHDQGGQLTKAVRDDPFRVLLFDEIDKADTSILSKFLQILDEGRLTDGRGTTTYFSETVIIFTSNHGSNTAPDALDDELAAAKKDPRLKEYVREDGETIQSYYPRVLQISQAFKTRPEILNRIGLSNIIPFNRITNPATPLKVLKRLRSKTKNHFREALNGIIVDFDQESEIDGLLIDKADYKKMGVRNVKQTFETEILEKLADQVIRNPTSKKFQVEVAGDSFKVTNEDAHEDDRK